MKLQHLAVIFILIIMPIVLVFSEYINNQITTVETEMKYDSKLLNATYDAIKAYQLNTINNSIADRSNSKIDDLEAAANTFFNSLVSSFGYSGYKAKVMEEYVPAVVFTLYDGYYIYSPFANTLTGVDIDDVDKEYKDDTINGIKSYVYYNKRYTGSNYDIVITYTLDNYITIEGTINGDYVFDSGYLITGITESSGIYIYDDITFSDSDTEEMKEYLYFGGTYEEYSYVKIDGTKFYLNGNEIFYLESSGDKHIQATKTDNPEVYTLYEQAIKKNKSAYTYYKNAYEFTDRVLNEYKLGDLTVDGKKIFEGTIQDSDSNFNEHRSEVIRNVIETNLSTAISGFSMYGSSKVTYVMPKISETDWNLIENNVCIATFLQGMSIGGKVYNSYSVVANNLTKEYVDENDIYILTTNNTYCQANDSTLSDDTIPNKSFCYPGFLKINFEKKMSVTNGNKIYYYPLHYLASYTSIVGSSATNNIEYLDMYKYMRDMTNTNDKLKKVYYTVLGRERMSAYNVNNGLKDEDKEKISIDQGKDSLGNTMYLNSNIDNWFYLRNYKAETESILGRSLDPK